MKQNYVLPKVLKKIIEHEYLVFLTLITIVLLYAHTIFLPLSGDDYFHQLVLDKNSELGLTSPITDLFKFAPGDQNFIKQSIEKVGLVWWTDPNLKISFFRPLSVLTHQLDHSLYPEKRYLHRIQSLLWLLANIFLAFIVYRKIYTNKIIVGLGILFFAFSIHNYLPVAWLAARNALLTCCLSLITFFFYYKACSEQWRPGFILTPVFLALALLCGEASLGITAFLFSCALFIDTRKKHIALLSLVPSACVAIIWLYVYQEMGYGSQNSGFYISPQEDLAKYMIRSLFSFPLLITGAIYNVPPNFANLSTSILYASVFLCLLLLIITILKLIKPFIREDKMISFWILAFTISLLPAMSVSAGSRTLVIPGIAGIGVLLSIFDNLLTRQIKVDLLTKRLLNFILGMHLLAPIALFLSVMIALPQFKKATTLLEPSFHGIVFEKNTSVFFIGNKPLQLVVANTRARIDKLVVPKQSITLITPNAPYSLERISEYELIASSKHSLFARFNEMSAQRLFRDTQKKPLYIGEKFRAGSVNIEILELNDIGQPIKIRFLFDEKISSKNKMWITTDRIKDKFVKMNIPKIGEKKYYTMN